MPKAKTPLKTLLSAPKLWLDSLPDKPLHEEHLQAALGDGPWRDIVKEVYQGSDAVEAAKFAIKDWETEVSIGLSKIEWLKALSVAQAAEKDGWERYLTKKFGPLTHIFDDGQKIVRELNQLHHAGSFAFERRIEFDPTIKVFRVYESRRGIWRLISNEEVVRMLMEYTIPMIQRSRIYKTNAQFFKSLLENAKSLALQPDRHRPYTVIAAANGVIALDDEKAFPSTFSPAYKLTNAVPAAFDSTGTHAASRFMKYLSGMLEPDDIDALQLWCGMALLGQNPFHKILVLSGAGNSGKSTLLSLIEQMIGTENVATLMSNRLEDRFELSGFLGKTLLTSKDASADFLSEKTAHMLKTLSGDRGLKVEVKFVQQRVTLEGPFNIGIACNAELLVTLRDDAEAWQRRLILILVKSQPPRPKNDPHFAETLIREEGQGILNWMLRGVREVRKLQRLGLTFPLTSRQQGVRDALLFRSENIPAFVKTCVTKDETAEISSEDLYLAYFNYCNQHGLLPAQEHKFYRQIGRSLTKEYQATAANTRKTKVPLKGYRGIKLVSTPANTSAVPAAAIPAAAVTTQ